MLLMATTTILDQQLDECIRDGEFEIPEVNEQHELKNKSTFL